MKRWQRYFLGFLLFLPLLGWGQTPAPKIVDIDHSDSLWVDQTIGSTFLQGNVRLRQGNVILLCHFAKKNDLINVVEAYGNVKILQGDSLTLTGDTAMYFATTRLAKVTGRTVILNDKVSTLKTRRLDYDMNTRIASYNVGGTVYDKKTTLVSKEGYYNTQTKLFNFYKNVKVNSPETDLYADSLRYSTLSKDVYFIAPTKIISKKKEPTAPKDTLLTKSGSYNLNTRISNFLGRSTVKTPNYELIGDTLFYDTPTQIGIARGNVVMISKKDSVLLIGQIGRYYGKTGISRIYGDAVMQKFFVKDTLFLSADTLISEEIRGLKDTTQRLTAIKNVLLFRTDMQGKCDSLVYNMADSLISFYKKPVLWNNQNQSEADTIFAKMVNNKLRTMYLNRRAFVIARDTLELFNQVKGRHITVRFDAEGQLNTTLVEGNGESIYFARKEDKKTIGMNYVQAAKMRLHFKNNQVKQIAFLGSPDGVLRPPKDVNTDNRELDGFIWRSKDRPTRAKVLRIDKNSKLLPRSQPITRIEVLKDKKSNN
ncbi:MAG: OstA-like protein [Siphonobacter sp.]